MKLLKYILFLFFSISIALNAEEYYRYSYKMLDRLPYGIFGKINDNLYSINYTIGSEISYLQIENSSENKSESTKKQIKLNGFILSSYVINNEINIFSIIDDSLLISKYDSNGTLIKSISKKGEFSSLSKIIINDYNTNLLIYSINSDLYLLNNSNNEIKLISKSVLCAKLFNEDIFYLRNNQNGASLFRYNDSIEYVINSKINVLNNARMIVTKNAIKIISGIKYDNSSEIIDVNIENGEIKNYWINSNIENVFYPKNDNFIFFLNINSNKFSIVKYDINKFLKLNEFPIEFSSSVFAIESNESEIFAIFDNIILSFDINLKIKSNDYFQFKNEFTEIDYILNINDYLLITNANKSIYFKKYENKYWWFLNVYNNFGKFIIPLILFVLLIILFRIYLKQKRLLDIFINENTGGATIILDKNGRIFKLNQTAMNLLDLSSNYNKRKKYSYYLVDDFTTQLKTFLDKSFSFKENISQKLIFSDSNLNKEWIFSSIPLKKITGKFDGILIKGVDITEELEKNRLYNWSQLAHDMQTNLTTIRLNTEQIKSNIPTEEERLSKILNQVNILIQRVRDIVTVGRNNELNLLEYDSAEICREVLLEFDKSVFPNVTFRLDVSSFRMKCDKPKMIRAIRNAIENGIKSMKGKSGEIVLSNSLDHKYYYFNIKDSGIGMDTEVKKKMLTPYFTTGSKSGGFGIGTMIMQHVIELHGGELKINSEPNKGTEIIFAIPNIYKPRKGSKTITRKIIT